MRKASVCLTTYSHDRLDECTACIEQVLAQDYAGAIEVVVVADHVGGGPDAAAVETVYDKLATMFAADDAVTVVPDPNYARLSTARNMAAEAATGDVYIFTDDDAYPTDGWLAALMEPYENGEIAVGGPAHPNWETDRPWYLPDEMLWLVGVTHAGFREDEGYVRNTFGCNVSFDADAFDAVGGFTTEFGKDHEKNLQGEETELCWRLYEEFGQQVYYVPDAAVEHTVYDYQTPFRDLADRAFWQGYTKAMFPDDKSRATEHGFLTHLLTRAIPGQVARGQVGHAVGNIAFTAATGLGYLAGQAR